jgi:cysteinyl-tRNA synthetase
MANYWMHNGFVRVDDEKMSKSLGNFFTIRDVLKKYKPEEVRFFILRAHYRSPLNYSDKHLDDAKAALTRLYTALRNIDIPTNEIDWQQPQAKRFKEAMDDDFNTPEAMAVLFDLANEVNKTKSIETASLLKGLGAVIGLLQDSVDSYLQSPSGDVIHTQTGNAVADGFSANITSGINTEKINEMILFRVEAKKTKNFAEADRIRKELSDAGIILEDTPQGTTWRRA